MDQDAERIHCEFRVAPDTARHAATKLTIWSTVHQPPWWWLVTVIIGIGAWCGAASGVVGVLLGGSAGILVIALLAAATWRSAHRALVGAMPVGALLTRTFGPDSYDIRTPTVTATMKYTAVRGIVPWGDWVMVEVRRRVWGIEPRALLPDAVHQWFPDSRRSGSPR
ncbi:hypothetical protein [Curtobacterium sp. Leaf261]|uniref:hypothetical protein n=1 Tax=Curtobacterium sp. Leaf261 TaxID=1736311 RepID=UPI0006F36C20|nr:hypothetical protein [Curtobacterium sp. Leaf261]KQO64548.1 hypothetical protein ASF23_16330 [Curtobacterium sp. Leaf261]